VPEQELPFNVSTDRPTSVLHSLIVHNYYASRRKVGPMSGDRHERHPELSLVTLARPVEAEGRVLPSGATGTVVHVYPEERAYEVEFIHPFHTLATVEAAAIRE